MDAKPAPTDEGTARVGRRSRQLERWIRSCGRRRRHTWTHRRLGGWRRPRMRSPGRTRTPTFLCSLLVPHSLTRLVPREPRLPGRPLVRVVVDGQGREHLRGDQLRRVRGVEHPSRHPRGGTAGRVPLPANLAATRHLEQPTLLGLRVHGPGLEGAAIHRPHRPGQLLRGDLPGVADPGLVVFIGRQARQQPHLGPAQGPGDQRVLEEGAPLQPRPHLGQAPHEPARHPQALHRVVGEPGVADPLPGLCRGQVVGDPRQDGPEGASLPAPRHQLSVDLPGEMGGANLAVLVEEGVPPLQAPWPDRALPPLPDEGLEGGHQRRRGTRDPTREARQDPRLSAGSPHQTSTGCATLEHRRTNSESQAFPPFEPSEAPGYDDLHPSTRTLPTVSRSRGTSRPSGE